MPDEPEQSPDANDSMSEEALDSLLADMTETDVDALQDESLQAAASEPPAQAANKMDSLSEPEPAGTVDPGLTFASFPEEVSPHPGEGNAFRGFERVQDIPLEVSVELGRTKLLIRDILDLETGAIVELEKMAGEPVDLLANGLLVARGEVVVIEDNFGVRITEIITQTERQEMTNWSEERLAA